MIDVAVVGAGPAGSAAAIELASSGASVTLVDKAVFPRPKCCGDGLTTGALRHLAALGVEPLHVASFTVVGRLVVRSPSGRLATIPLGDGSGVAAAVAERVDLDAALLGRAREVGASTRLGSAVRSLTSVDGAVKLTFEDGETLVAGIVVAADGAWSTIRKLLAPSDTARPTSRVGTNWTAFRAYAEGVGSAASDALYVLFDEAVLPGYIWSFPLPDRRANVGVYVARDKDARGAGLAWAWERARRDPFLLSILGPDARLGAPARAWPIPTSLDTDPTALDGRVLFAGDALGAADPFTGEGIAQALETGSCAAAAILGGTTPAEIAAAYRHALSEGLVPDHSIAAAFSTIFRRPRAARGAVRVSGVGGLVGREVGRWLYEDYARAALRRPSRWREAFRRAPLPYASLLRTSSTSS